VAQQIPHSADSIRVNRAPALSTGAGQVEPSLMRQLLRAIETLVAAAALSAGLAVVPAQAVVDPGSTLASLANSERAARGIPALTWRADLAEVAARWAGVMAASGTLAHNPALGSEVVAWSGLAENVGYAGDAGTLHAAWMASAGHRANLLSTSYSEIGVGVAVTNGRVWGVEVFRRPIAAQRPADRNFVGSLYQDFLGRAVDGPSLDRWGALLAAGQATRQSNALALAASPEWVGKVVDHLYQDTLGRGPDPSGRANWVAAIQSGMTVADVAASFYASEEYFAGFGRGDLGTWVEDLYRKILGRSSDPAGKANWIIAAAVSGRVAVARPFFQSLESRIHRVDNLYVQLLDRHADPTGLGYWPTVIVQSGDLALASFLAGSEEYYVRAQR
jgi:hypothetical protein